MRLSPCVLAMAPLLVTAAGAAEFDRFGSAAPDLVAVAPASDFVFVLGLGIGTAPVYEGAAAYGMTFKPIVDVERLKIPGILDIGGGPDLGGFSFAPSFSYAGARVSAEHAALVGLPNVDPTYALGVQLGYEVLFNDTVRAKLYGAARYAFGGAQGLVGEVGVDVTARLNPQLELVGGPVINFASEGYMDRYFGVTAAQSAATGGRLAAYDPAGGIKSVGIKVAARYEFVPDTFLNLDASYTAFAGDARMSPIVTSGSQHQFTLGLGLSHRFAF